jgi:DNA-binding response OmpR family regulator
MLTARGHVLTRQQAEGSGAALFITKPFSPNQLLLDVQRLTKEAGRAPSGAPVSPPTPAPAAAA